MSLPIELPSGKILDLTRFVALFPTGKLYDLILEGYSSPLELEETDADAIKQLLFNDSYFRFWSFRTTL
jgi:hypothetical protein